MENIMKMKLVGRNVALMVVFGVLGLTQFTENVRTVQVLGLFVSGVVVGGAWTRIVSALTEKRNKE
jgi:CHASE1-domain containing sensor protein